jgi:hypothetical protein
VTNRAVGKAIKQRTAAIDFKAAREAPAVRPRSLCSR